MYYFKFFLIHSASVGSILCLSLIVHIFAWNIPSLSLIFLKRSLVFTTLMFSSISLHWSLGSAGSRHEELRSWQRSWGRKLGIRKGVIKPQETPCSRASTPKTRVLYGELSPITISLGEGVNLQLQVNKNSWAWQECFNLQTLKVI